MMKSNETKNRKGFLFSVSVIILLIPLIIFITFYNEVSETEMEDTSARSRCDKLHFFIEDIKKDMRRALDISARRALIAAVEHVAETGVPLDGKRFQCTDNCEFNCSRTPFEYKMNGSSAVITELMLCGTMDGENHVLMKNHTFTRWFNKIVNHSRDMHYNLSFDVIAMDLGHRDAWSIYSAPIIRLSVQDDNKMCSYKGVRYDIVANTSIIGLQDPLHPINTNRFVWKTIRNCSTDNLLEEEIIGCSGDNASNNSAVGWTVFYSDIEVGGGITDLANYCTGTDEEDLEEQILVFDVSPLPGGLCTSTITDCFNASTDSHFGGIIVYDDVAPFTIDQLCYATIPWIIDTGDIDNRAPYNMRETACKIHNDTQNISTSSCAYTLTNLNCSLHKVGLGVKSGQIRTRCFSVSDVNETYNNFCGTEEVYNGPSYLDRLDGRLYLSEKYVEQSRKRYNTTLIGIETIVDVFDLKNYSSLIVNKSLSWVDYLFWGNKSGCPVLGSCEDRGYAFRMDCVHAFKYNIDTECASSACCPTGLKITTCRSGVGPYKVRYILIITTRNDFPLNITPENPEITVFVDRTVTGPVSMDETEFGVYNHTQLDVLDGSLISAQMPVNIRGCRMVSNSTKPIRVENIAPCT